MFKYINKGFDQITAAIVNNQNQDGTHNQVHDEIKHYLDQDGTHNQVHDEIKHYLDCRYVSIIFSLNAFLI